MTPDRSTGVQQEWTIQVCPACQAEVYEDGYFPCGHDNTAFILAHPEFESTVNAFATSVVEGERVPLRHLVPRTVRVVEAVSPEPRETWEGASAGDRMDDLLVEAGPLEGEQHSDPLNLRPTIRRGPEPKVEADNPSVASVLRLTASRLRDPEHRWSEDPAVTLERLAEKLERSGDG